MEVCNNIFINNLKFKLTNIIKITKFDYFKNENIKFVSIPINLEKLILKISFNNKDS